MNKVKARDRKFGKKSINKLKTRPNKVFGKTKTKGKKKTKTELEDFLTENLHLTVQHFRIYIVDESLPADICKCH